MTRMVCLVFYKTSRTLCPCLGFGESLPVQGGQMYFLCTQMGKRKNMDSRWWMLGNSTLERQDYVRCTSPLGSIWWKSVWVVLNLADRGGRGRPADRLGGGQGAVYAHHVHPPSWPRGVLQLAYVWWEYGRWHAISTKHETGHLQTWGALSWQCWEQEYSHSGHYYTLLDSCQKILINKPLFVYK